MRKIISTLVCSLMLMIQPSYAAISLSGDNWKDPLRTKTWTPPNESGVLLLENSTQNVTNKTIDGDFNTLLNVPVDFTAGVAGQLPIANGTNFVNKTTAETVAGNKTLTGETTFNNRVTMTDMINIDRPAGIVKTDSSGNIEVGTVNLSTEVVGSLSQNNCRLS